MDDYYRDLLDEKTKKCDVLEEKVEQHK